jgi:hypothetical protein
MKRCKGEIESQGEEQDGKEVESWAAWAFVAGNGYITGCHARRLGGGANGRQQGATAGQRPMAQAEVQR